MQQDGIPEFFSFSEAPNKHDIEEDLGVRCLCVRLHGLISEAPNKLDIEKEARVLDVYSCYYQQKRLEVRDLC
ncbi:hypothetical protein FHG87_004242 [Trinorchestia longiramus]|nr:hypothetical protein FHG87_004242 [Trinorchestia longiramus]